MRQTRQYLSDRPVPKGASVRCRAGFHRGQENGGTMGFTCTDCRGFYAHDRDFSGLTAAADAMIDRGEDGAAFAHGAIREHYR